jgi:hypothetical protein
MNERVCPHCGQTNRATARFCARCGQDMNAASIAQKAAQAVGPAAQQVAGATWQGSKRGATFLGRALTLGGKAAYSELFQPAPVVAGPVASIAAGRSLPAPLEWPFFLFMLLLLFGWLIIFMPEGWQIGLVLAVWFLALILLNFAGVRRPYFSALTTNRLLRGVGHVPAYEFHLYDQASNQTVRVEVQGGQQVAALAPQNYVQVYGIKHSGQGEVRAWRVDVLNQQGQGYTAILSPRLIPLTVALFLPGLVALVAWIIKLLV